MKNVKGARITFEQISEYFARVPLKTLQENDDFVNDRHWNNGYYWIGWRPMPDLTGRYSEVALRQWDYVCKSFTQKNVIGSNVKRLVGAILGNEPDFNIHKRDQKDVSANAAPTPSPDEKFYADLEKTFIEYWTREDVHKQFKKLVENKASYGKFAIFPHIPSGYIEPREIIEQNADGIETKRTVYGFSEAIKTIEDALDKIKIEVVHYSNFIDIPDTEFGTKFTIVKLAANTENGAIPVERFGVFYVDTDKQSYFRVVDKNNNESKISADLGGNNMCLTYGEYTDALVTESTKTLQKSVNHAETSSNYASANMNYPETTFINAEEIEEEDAYGKPTGRKAKPLSGAGIFRYLRGIVDETINGTQTLTPQIHERKGVEPEVYSKESERKARSIDELMGMGWKHQANSEYASGDSKEQAMDDLDILLADYETAMNTAGTAVIENVLRLAFHLTNQTNRNKDFSVVFRVNVSQGKLTNEDKTVMQAEVDKGLRSAENYILKCKVNDTPKNEIQAIAAQPQVKPRMLPEPVQPPKPAPAK